MFTQAQHAEALLCLPDPPVLLPARYRPRAPLTEGNPHQGPAGGAGRVCREAAAEVHRGMRRITPASAALACSSLPCM